MLKKLMIDDLRPGMRVVEPKSGLWMSHPTLYCRPGVIRDEQHLLSIRKQGYTFAFVDGQAEDTSKPLTNRGTIELASELERAKAIYAEVAGVAQQFFVQAAGGKKLALEPGYEAVESIGDSVSRNPDALHCLARLTPLEGHLATHSANVAVLCVVLARHLGLDDEATRELGLAGLLHDIGKVRIPLRVLEKKERLTAQEVSMLRKHPAHGVALLESQNVSERLIRGVSEHHERYDGKGYPMNMVGERISLFARYIALADAFDAMTSKRNYQKAMVPNRALALIYKERNSQFAPQETAMFIKCLGVYPTGSLVRLSDGRVGVVYEPNPEMPLSPIVNVVLDDALKPITPQVVNLAEGSHASDPLEVEAALCPQDEGLDLSALMRASGF